MGAKRTAATRLARAAVQRVRPKRSDHRTRRLAPPAAALAGAGTGMAVTYVIDARRARRSATTTGEPAIVETGGIDSQPDATEEHRGHRAPVMLAGAAGGALIAYGVARRGVPGAVVGGTGTAVLTGAARRLRRRGPSKGAPGLPWSGDGAGEGATGYETPATLDTARAG